MARRVFFSFHFAGDFWRTQQVRNINALEGQSLCTPNEWEQVKGRGSAAIEKWIDEQMSGKTCVVVLVGSETAERPWVLHEISKGWNNKRGVLGIRIDRLLDENQKSSTPGANPFLRINFTGTSRTLDGLAPLKSPAGADSKGIYASIANNIEQWIEEAITIRNRH
jgi:hypothetical protein